MPEDQAGGELERLSRAIRGCAICAARFAATRTAHAPRPAPWLSDRARVLIAGQAPGARVHARQRPFDDASGERLRDWLGVDRTAFYDRARFAALPMAFCFPGYDAKGADLPPPPVCARTWRAQALGLMPQLRLTILVGGHAQRWHLGPRKDGVSATVRAWREWGEGVIPLPHPSWRNTGWLRRNPWFADEVLPALRRRVARALAEEPTDGSG